MKQNNKNIKVGIFIVLIAFLIPSCSKYLEKEPIGTLSEINLANKSGVERLLTGAYSRLEQGSWESGKFLFGGIASDDAHFGTTNSGVWIALESYALTPDAYILNSKWTSLYGGAQSANDVIRVLNKVPSGEISESDAIQIRAEAVFLRGIQLFQAAMVFGEHIPYVDENITISAGNYNVPNNESIWIKLEQDFEYAAANLAPTNSDAGRANNWAAKCFKALVYLFEHKYPDAQNLLNDIISNGVTTSGQKYGLVKKFSDIYDPRVKNHEESVFAVQMTVNDGDPGPGGEGSWNGNLRTGLGYSGPAFGPFTAYGFYQPSFSLVNSFKVDPSTGLPLIYTFNDFDVKNDQGILSSEPFTPTTETLDPRLDLTVGRRGLPYLDWGINPGYSWIRSPLEQGPYIIAKMMCPQGASNFIQRFSKGVNDILIRYAEVLLWAAEVEVEIGSLSKAQDYVNMVRNRVSDPSTWVHTYIDPDDPLKGFTDIPAANYKIGLYPPGYFESQGKDFAREAVRFEEKLELAMEMRRFFNLQRWDNGTGYMADVLNAYIQHEINVPNYFFNYMLQAKFIKGKNEVFPIPLSQIDLSTTNDGPTLIQNPGY